MYIDSDNINSYSFIRIYSWTVVGQQKQTTTAHKEHLLPGEAVLDGKDAARVVIDGAVLAVESETDMLVRHNHNPFGWLGYFISVAGPFRDETAI